jgi:hypothetical protein
MRASSHEPRTCHDRLVSDHPDPNARWRRTVAMLLAGGGGAALLSGVVTGSVTLVIFGVGWLIGGGAIRSLEPKDNPEG